MLGYDKIKRANYFHFEELLKWKNRKWISDEVFEKLCDQIMPRYKHTNLFLNIGLFLLTSVIVSSALGFVTLFTFDFFSLNTFWFPSLLTGSLLLLALQRIVIQDKNQFRTGADDATLYYALSFFFGFFFSLFESILLGQDLAISAFLVIFFAIAAYIYLDRLLTALTVLSFVGFIFLALFKLGTGVALFIPFVLMPLSAVGYFVSFKKIQSSTGMAEEQCLEIINWICIALFYLSGNYFVVTELSTQLGLASTFPIPIIWFLYVFTIAVPLLFVYFGIKRTELILINLGLVALAVGIFTIRYYHNIMPIELALIIGGSALILTAWIALRYWSTDKGGITVRPDESTADGLTIESLVINQTLSNSSTENQFTGQGGKFGGGGSSGSF